MIKWKEEFKKLDPEVKKEIATFKEISCYFLINVIGETIFKSKHAQHSERPSLYPKFTFAEECSFRVKQTYVVLQLTKFGLENPTKGEESNYAPTEEYLAWFKWWHEYIQNTLTAEEWATLDKKLSNKEDVSEYRPEGDWRDNIVKD